MDIQEISNRILYFRNSKNISARELSLSIGKNANYINQLESLAFIIPADTLLVIIDNLGITPAEFFAEDYKNYKTKKSILNLLEDIANNISQDKITELLSSLKQ